jgi:hypothetical protein
VGHDLRRMARLRAGGLSFGASVALGLGLGHAKSGRPRGIKYNGDGLDGDRRAIEAVFEAATARGAPPDAGHDK